MINSHDYRLPIDYRFTCRLGGNCKLLLNISLKSWKRRNPLCTIKKLLKLRTNTMFDHEIIYTCKNKAANDCYDREFDIIVDCNNIITFRDPRNKRRNLPIDINNEYENVRSINDDLKDIIGINRITHGFGNVFVRNSGMNKHEESLISKFHDYTTKLMSYSIFSKLHKKYSNASKHEQKVYNKKVAKLLRDPKKCRISALNDLRTIKHLRKFCKALSHKVNNNHSGLINMRLVIKEANRIIRGNKK